MPNTADFDSKSEQEIPARPPSIKIAVGKFKGKVIGSQAIFALVVIVLAALLFRSITPDRFWPF